MKDESLKQALTFPTIAIIGVRMFGGSWETALTLAAGGLLVSAVKSTYRTGQIAHRARRLHKRKSAR